MSFGFAAGLWSFAGVLLLLLICFIQRKREERKVSSLYLWRLAAKYLQRNAFAAKVKKAILFALRILSAVLACLMISKLMFQMPGSGMYYVAVIDASASMRVCDENGASRFSAACQAAEKDIAALPWGSRASVILAGDEAELAAESVTPGNELYDTIHALNCGWGSGDLDGAMKICRQLAGDGQASSVMLYTDRAVLPSDGMAVTDVRRGSDWNFAVRSMTVEGSAKGLTLQAEVLCSGRDAEIPVEVLVNGEAMDHDRMSVVANGEECRGFVVPCRKDVPVSLTVTVRQMYDYEDVCLQMISGDGLAADDAFTVFRQAGKTIKACLMGEKNYFMEKVLSVFPQVELETLEKPTATEGYDLYIYEHCLPTAIPADGAVWFLDPPSEPKLGMTFGEMQEGEKRMTAAKFFTDESLMELTDDLLMEDVLTVRLREVTETGNFQPVLLCEQMPAMLAGKTEQGSVALVTTFNLQNSSLPMQPDFVTLTRNMLSYSVPAMVEGQICNSGEPLTLRTLPLCEAIYVQNPDKSVTVMKESPFTLMPKEPGVYTLLQQLNNGRSKSISLYARIPEAESTGIQDVVRLPDVLQEAGNTPAEKDEDAVDLTRLLAILLMLCLMAEWMVYHAEKY